ncbi:alkaline phosphatase PhoX [Cellvibrio sp. pealriver]|uniref:alkaline phosphatase PhoX n=1 Tax=Cellvibrio sp. pealriver TaxID=1622269 RepID=UPI00069CDD8B|nr:alkaline phosphatase PhoX [Cellvibrio sp. pealriver]
MPVNAGQLSRRHFLKNASAVALALGGLRSLQLQAQVYAQDPVYGIDKVGQLLLDPAGILNLPRHFSYRVISRTGDRMSDGLITPSAPDGMAAFPVPGNPSQCILVRNHELASSLDEIDPFGGDRKLARKHVGDKAYDNHLLTMRPVNGGTSTLLFDHRSGRVERSHLSLIGTARNCAGGATPWGSWLTCEESLVGKLQGYGREHGYVFEVPSLSKGLVDAVPLKDMGRFMHEAAAVDSTSGIVYLSEDYERGLFYRFLPKVPGKLAQGGRLQALAIRGWPKANTRNWPEDSTDKHAQSVAINQRFECEWIDLEEVTSPDGDLSKRGEAKGAAIFARGEGLAFALRDDNTREVLFAATGGGPNRIGQVWRYQPSPYEGTAREAEQPGTMELLYESHNRAVLESCDNIAVAPWGDLIICEDSYSDNPDTVNYLRGLTPEGKIYTLAMNAHPEKGEFCGACFSPDGTTLFVNIQRPGMTLAITGPWGHLRNQAKGMDKVS